MWFTFPMMPPPCPPNRKLSPREEVSYLSELYRHEMDKVLERVLHAYDTLQARAQMLLSLVAICLTVTGFSGPAIARSGAFCRFTIVLGMLLIVLSAILMLYGPLQLRWATQWRADTVEQSIENLIRRRNRRTERYHAALILLAIGLFFYCLSVMAYMLGGAPR